jgi:hypothetical protein
MPLHEEPCSWPQEGCSCRPACGQCGGAGYVSNIGCCGHGLPSGECCGNGIEIQDPCEHCQTTGNEPAPALLQANGVSGSPPSPKQTSELEEAGNALALGKGSLMK